MVVTLLTLLWGDVVVDFRVRLVSWDCGYFIVATMDGFVSKGCLLRVLCFLMICC